jgi:hypothetical protein
VSATYRIEVRYADDETIFPWMGVIVRLVDDWPVRVERERTAEHALEAARQWIADEYSWAKTPTYFYVDDQGRDAEAPQSVKV